MSLTERELARAPGTTPADLDPPAVSPGPADTSVADDDLLAQHLPILSFDARERFTPISVERYLGKCRLHHGDRLLLDCVRPDDLDERWGPETHLRFVTDEERRAVFRSDLAQSARRLLSPRLGLVGLFGRLIDALFLVVVLLRPTTPNSTAAAAERKCELLHRTPTVYGRTMRAGEWLVLHYAWLYGMNDWRTGYRGMNDHEGDWEQAWIFVDPGDLTPQWVALSNHDYSGADLRRHWSDPELAVRDGRPVLHVAAGSHAGFFGPGDYVSRFDLPGLRWLQPLRLIGRRLLSSSAAERETGGGPVVGIPFVDSARGDGRQITDWRLEPLDGAWCSRFRGLWGIDTGDPLQSERGPSGPKFDRKGTIRLSWADPLGFAGLHGSVPPSARNRRVNITKLEQALADLDAEIRAHGRRLPLIRQATGRDVAAASERLSDLLRQREELEGLMERFEAGVGLGSARPSGEPDVRGHLVSPAVPLDDHGGATPIVSLWAMLTIPIVFGAFGFALVSTALPAAPVLLLAAVGAGIVEQLLRRRFVDAAKVTLIAAAIGGTVWAAVGRVWSVSHLLIGGGLIVAALGLVIVNAREWYRSIASAPAPAPAKSEP